jgi:hypothetical protein
VLASVLDARDRDGRMGRGEEATMARARTTIDDEGMTTAEYAIGTVAACAFAGLLLKLVTSSEVAGLLRDAVRHAFSVAF